jgi:hypothetical protein
MRLVSAVALAASLTGCSALDGAADDGTIAPEAVASDTTLRLRAARWEGAWTPAGAEQTAAGGFRTTTDEGYTVVIDEAWLVNYAVTLVPCEESEAVALRLLGIGTAQAHHGEFEDPSQLEPVLVEPFADPQPTTTELGRSTFPGASYCGVHWLIARGDDTSLAPDGSSAADRAVHLTGSWHRGDERGVILIDTSLAQGMLRTLDEVHVVGTGAEALITIERQLGTMFDGIDFATANPNLVDWEVVSNLVEQSSVRIEGIDLVDGATF